MVRLTKKNIDGVNHIVKENIKIITNSWKLKRTNKAFTISNDNKIETGKSFGKLHGTNKRDRG